LLWRRQTAELRSAWTAEGGCPYASRMRQRGGSLSQNEEAARQEKSRSPKAPAVQLVVCPDKTFVETRLAGSPAYALRRGRTVKSRTCARMLDICIPLSWDR
jgi:hypothetical protein